MRPMLTTAAVLVLAIIAAVQRPSAQQHDPARLAALKQEAVTDIDGRYDSVQLMLDMVFSFGELGYQEIETSKYLSGILEKNGFKVERNVGGLPTGWVARWGSGKPIIALGSDIDGIPQGSQKPGVAYHEPIVEGAPGHGEGHNSGVPLNITAALAAKRLMEREHLSGTLVIWPGVAEELLGGKAFFVRAGVFKDVDAVLFAHVSDSFSVSWGSPKNSTGLISIQYDFQGEPAHAGAGPWRGRSALDAVELMDVGWNFRREHLRVSQRSHYVIPSGGYQPNVVPEKASTWYYLREIDYPHIMELRETADRIAQGAALMTDTTVTSHILGSAWPQHFNKPMAEAEAANISAVGMPSWDAADVALARGIQKELKQEQTGLTTKALGLQDDVPLDQNMGGGSDDIGDVSWNVPTITLRYPANIPNLPGHHWANAIAMATPIAYKGTIAGAKAQAMTVLDLMMRPELIDAAKAFFADQTKAQRYEPMIGPADAPALDLNKRVMDMYRPEMRKHYFDPARYKTYMQQLGITYPTVRP